MQCLYKTLHLLPSATDFEVRTAYRRFALSTHPDKGESAEAFRSVVHAFETLVDARRRATDDQLWRPNQSPSAPVRKDVHHPKKRQAESRSTFGKPPKAKDKRKPAKRAKDAREPPQKQQKPDAPSATTPDAEMDCNPGDHPQLFCHLLRIPRKQALKEFQNLSEQRLNAFARLDSDEPEEILNEPHLHKSRSPGCLPCKIALRQESSQLQQ